MLLLATLAFAQSPDLDELPEAGSTPVIYEAITEHTFEGVKVDGAVVRPDGVVTIERRRAVFATFIRLRDNWEAELGASVQQVR